MYRYNTLINAILISMICMPCSITLAVDRIIPVDTLYYDVTFGQGKDISLNHPDAFTALPDGSVLVSDDEENRLVHFSSDGEFLGTFGTLGSGENQFYNPTDIICNSETIFIADRGNQRIAMLSCDLSWKGAIDVEIYPDVIALSSDSTIFVGSRYQLPDGNLLMQYDLKGHLLGSCGTPFGTEEDPFGCRTAINILTASMVGQDHLFMCFKGLAYCKCCKHEDEEWQIKYDIDIVRTAFYENYFPSKTLFSISGRNKVEDFVDDLRDKYSIDHAVNVVLFIQDIIGVDDRMLAVVFNTIHEYSNSGELLKRSIILDGDGEQISFERIAMGLNNQLFVMSKYHSSSCWRVNYNFQQNYMEENHEK